MPGLRGASGAVHELRSSKSLIGASPSKCDVVVRHAGVRELHALLTLAPDRASATLVPFSASREGVCFLNRRAVPPDGAVVVHGDRLAFGSPDADSFTFEITGASSQRVPAASTRSSTASFRRALDALRGDRLGVVASPPRGSSGAAAPRAAAASLAPSSPTASGFKSQLGRFLLDASSDALLSEFVERKLRQSSARKRTNAPRAMEPPPSLSSSSVSSARSQAPALEDSILGRSRADAASRSADTLADSFRSTGERDGLTGQAAVRASDLAAPSTASLRQQQQQRRARDHSVDGADTDAQEDSELESDDDELPAMVEKKLPVEAVARAAIPAPSPPRQLDASADHDVSASLSDSLPGFSEPTRHLAEPVRATRASERPPAKTARAPKTQRTALHQQLIDQTLRHKRQELVALAFVRWRRGLRIQSQRRQLRAQQLRNVRERLVRLRRDRAFAQWRALAEVSSQVLSCRVDAFQARAASRLLVRAWTRWQLRHCSQSQRRRQLLRGIVRRLAAAAEQRAFHSWLRCTRELGNRDATQRTARAFERRWEERMAHVAGRHHAQHFAQRTVRALLRRWHSLAATQLQRRRVLEKLAVRGSSRLKLRGWRKWTEAAAVARRVDAVDSAHNRRLDLALDTERRRQSAAATAQQIEREGLQEQLAARDQQLLELQARAKTRDADLRRLQELQHDSSRRAESCVRAWHQSVETHLESAIKRSDRQIAQASHDLEQILSLAEEDAAAARFAAARVLVDVVLEQKVHNSNERVRVQDELLRRRRLEPPAKAPPLEPPLGAHAKFLRDMAQQRVMRLHQLLGAIAKLAAAVSSDASTHQQFDAARLDHSTFLADAVLEREQRHLVEMATALFRLSAATSSPSDPPPPA